MKKNIIILTFHVSSYWQVVGFSGAHAWFFYFCKYFFIHIIHLWSMNLLHKCFTFKNQIKISEKVMSLRRNFTTSNIRTMSSYRPFLIMVHEEDVQLNHVQLQTLLTKFFVHCFSHHTASEAVLPNYHCACGKIFQMIWMISFIPNSKSIFFHLSITIKDSLQLSSKFYDTESILKKSEWMANLTKEFNNFFNKISPSSSFPVCTTWKIHCFYFQMCCVFREMRFILFY